MIGQTIGITGPAAAAAQELNLGARIVLDRVNAEGGVRGQKIELMTLDDGFEPQRAYENAKNLVQNKRVVALFLSRGTPTTESILPVLDEADVALIGPSTGAESLRQPVLRHVFNVRGAYRREAQHVIEHLMALGRRHIAIVRVSDNFGGDSLWGALEALQGSGLQPALVQDVGATGAQADIEAAVDEIRQAKADAVFIAASAPTTASIIRRLRASGEKMPVATMSPNASAGFVALLGDAGRGVMVSQVMPRERGTAAMLAQEVSIGARQRNAKVSPVMLEGATSAKLLVEALRQVKGPLTRQSLMKTLESEAGFDLGWGLSRLRFTPTDHEGIRRTDIAVIDADGEFLR